VAFQSANPEELQYGEFEQMMLLQDPTVGCLARGGKKSRILSTPHSASLIDLDGDCMSDLFLTVYDPTSGRNYYEIYIRREKEEEADSEGEP